MFKISHIEKIRDVDDYSNNRDIYVTDFILSKIPSLSKVIQYVFYHLHYDDYKNYLKDRNITEINAKILKRYELVKIISGSEFEIGDTTYTIDKCIVINLENTPNTYKI